MKTNIEVRVQPSASRNACTIDESGRIRIALTAPPVEGAANSALVAFLAKRLGIPKRDIEVVRGQTARQKLIAVEGLPGEIILDRLREQ